MNAFAVMSKVENPALNEAVEEKFPGASLKLAENTWLVAAKGLTTREVAETIGAKRGGISGVVVARIDSYSGFASRDIWEWLKVKSAETPDGDEFDRG
jgi:hypothetical protein